MNHWKKWTWAYDHLKLVICQRITSKNTRPRWVDTWACGTVRWYWSADTLFWQLSIDHNIDVQLVFSWAAKLARKCETRHWFPCGAVGRTVTWLPNFLGWVDYHISLPMGLRTRELSLFTLKHTSHQFTPNEPYNLSFIACFLYKYIATKWTNWLITLLYKKKRLQF